MRKLVYFVAVTLDGFIAAPDGSVDFFDHEGDHLAAQIEEYPETLPVHVRAALGITDRPPRHFDTMIMGRGTLQPGLDAGISSPYPHLRQYVLSRTIADSTDPTITVVREDPLGLARSLREGDGLDVWLAGGGDLAGQLMPAVDELLLKIHPVVLGTGIPLAAAGSATPVSFVPATSREFGSGVRFTRMVRRSPGRGEPRPR